MAVYKSNDEGYSWTVADINNTEGVIEALAVNPVNKSCMIAGGNDTDNAHVFKSETSGESWTELSPSVFGTCGVINALTYDPAGNGKIYAATDAGLKISADNGRSWTAIMDPKHITSITFDQRGSRRIFIGTVNSGVYYSSAEKHQFKKLGSGFPNAEVTALAFDNRNGVLYACLNPGGVWKCDITTSVEDDRIVPDINTLKLAKNYPNPFNSCTQISFTLSEAGSVTFAIYDLRGRIVRTMEKGYLEKGEHTLKWDGRLRNGSSAPSGVYVIECRCGDVVKRLKAILSR